MKNKYCEFTSLVNEADVEQNFSRRFIEDLGYADSQIKPKTSLQDLVVRKMRGQPEAYYKPDFAIEVNGRIRWIFEAKSPNEDLDAHVWQPKGYCHAINSQFKDENPVKYYVLSNGAKTRLYKNDYNECLLELDFMDFNYKSLKFQQLSDYLSPKAFESEKPKPDSTSTLKLRKVSLEEINAAFAWCHQYIYKKDNMSQASAFTEFVKVVFLKLLSDRRIRDKYSQVLTEDVIDVPIEDVRFSLHWLLEQEKHTSNPLNSIQFRDFINSMERAIVTGERKRIFDEDEQIKLSAETIRGVVGKLQSFFLFGIDVDLNGRLFETFLNATMRGKDLGQFFTPRSVVKLGTLLGRANVNTPKPDGSFHTDVVMDACCGTGGFLIEALANMWDKVDANSSLDATEKDALKKKIANHHLFGVDIGKDPHLARIARLNMYLHGDGGSGIFQTDILDKSITETDNDPPEIVREKNQLRTLLQSGNFADLILTNPPFAKTYERKEKKETKILDEYRIGRNQQSVKSSLLFIERYHDLLKVGGRMVTVIDDGILNGKKYSNFRNFIRENFIIKAVISLPGDAFQRSKARVKTSLLILEKRNPDRQQTQPSVFMYGCRFIGIDDPSRQRTLPIDKFNREKAKGEIKNVLNLYERFLSGEGDQKYLVAPEKIQDRLDVKSCLLQINRQVSAWEKAGVPTSLLSDLVEPKKFQEGEIIDTKDYDDNVTYLRVRYDGFPEKGEEMVASDTEYPELYQVKTNDIVISNIAASYGSVAVVPSELSGCVVSSEYTILTAKNGVNPRIVWALLRSPEIRADLLILATGISRNRIKWTDIKHLRVPIPPNDIQIQTLEKIRIAEEGERIAKINREEAQLDFETGLGLNSNEATEILEAFKPPK